MNIDHSNLRLRRGLTLVALATTLGLSVLGLTRCRVVEDTVTGVDVRSNSGFNDGHSDCVHQCNKKFKRCDKAEEARHTAAIRACGLDRACKRAENRLHEALHHRCVRDMQRCKKNCRYREGSGSAGR